MYYWRKHELDDFFSVDMEKIGIDILMHNYSWYTISIWENNSAYCSFVQSTTIPSESKLSQAYQELNRYLLNKILDSFR